MKRHRALLARGIATLLAAAAASTAAIAWGDDLRRAPDRASANQCRLSGTAAMPADLPIYGRKRGGKPLARFTGEPTYEHADPRRGEHRDWGTLVFDYGRPEVRNFLLANAVYWLVFLLFLPAVLDALALQGLLEPVQGMINNILGFLPNIFAAGLILNTDNTAIFVNLADIVAGRAGSVYTKLNLSRGHITGFDGAINHKTEPVREAVKTHCHDGIDVYFDNVGGKILDAVLSLINIKARIVICGLISQYNAAEPVPGPYNFRSILTQRARVQGFIILDYVNRFQEAIADLGKWLTEGKIQYRVDVIDGLENAPRGINKLFDGSNKGKLMVKV